MHAAGMQDGATSELRTASSDKIHKKIKPGHRKYAAQQTYPTVSSKRLGTLGASHWHAYPFHEYGRWPLSTFESYSHPLLISGFSNPCTPLHDQPSKSICCAQKLTTGCLLPVPSDDPGRAANPISKNGNNPRPLCALRDRTEPGKFPGLLTESGSTPTRCESK